METKQKFSDLLAFFNLYNDGVTAVVWHYEDSNLRLTLLTEGTRFVDIEVLHLGSSASLELTVSWNSQVAVSPDRFEEATAMMLLAKSIVQHALRVIGQAARYPHG